MTKDTRFAIRAEQVSLANGTGRDSKQPSGSATSHSTLGRGFAHIGDATQRTHRGEAAASVGAKKPRG
jgi:hypothetical protein